MAITYSIPIGPPTALVQNQVYALPGVSVTLFTDSAAPVLEQSNNLAFTTSLPVTLTNGAAEVNGTWLRATSAGVVVTLKRESN